MTVSCLPFTVGCNHNYMSTDLVCKVCFVHGLLIRSLQYNVSFILLSLSIDKCFKCTLLKCVFDSL